LKRSSAILALLLGPGLATAEAPLSAIDWLTEPPPVSVAQPLLHRLDRPPAGARVPDVTVAPLEAARPDTVGLLPPAITGLPHDLWAASRAGHLIAQIETLPDTPLPAAQALYYTLLLAEADPPLDAGRDARFLRARLDTLRRFGAVDAALALAERAGPATPALFDTWLDLALLKGVEDAPCAALMRRPQLSASYGRRIFCTARAGDWPTAALIFDDARALGLLDSLESALLSRFLDPEAMPAGPDLPPPRQMTPLIFRLFEANGRPLPTGSLPRAYAVADLRGTMGWKAEIEAAERLARAGAVPANRLLGLYTARAPAASGGVWERVRAIQALDTALGKGDRQAIAAALPRAWRAMSGNGLGIVLATLFGDKLARLDLPDEAALAHRIALLAPDDGPPPPAPPDLPRGLRFADSLARGAPEPAGAQSPTERAILAAFTAAAPPPDQARLLARGQLGEAILAAAAGLDRRGSKRALEAALATLRHVGLEKVARRAALQILLLPGPG